LNELNPKHRVNDILGNLGYQPETKIGINQEMRRLIPEIRRRSPENTDEIFVYEKMPEPKIIRKGFGKK
jgi:hypothetical protein